MQISFAGPWRWAFLLLALAGCSKADVRDLASSVRNAATQGVQDVTEAAKDVKDQVVDQAQSISGDVREELQMAGSLRLTLAAPAQTQACYARWVATGSGRPNVLQLLSYRDVSEETFPSVLVHARTSAASLAELAGQTVEAAVYVQLQQDAPVLSTAQDLIPVRIDGVQDGVLKGQILEGMLVQADSGAVQPARGDFEAVVQLEEAKR